MYIINGIAYTGTPKEERHIISVKVLDGMMMILKFQSREERLFDAAPLLEYPALKPLQDDNIFRNVKIGYGTLSWDNGNIE